MEKIQFNNSDILLTKLLDIGAKLSAEKDIRKLLSMILTESMAIVGCDAGSIYIVEESGDERNLVFKYTMNMTKSFPFNEFRMPINMNSIAGACASTGDSYNFQKMTEVETKLGFKHNTSFDESYGYKTVNMLVIPLTNYKEEVIGVIQLINKKIEPYFRFSKKEDYDAKTTPFTTEDKEIIKTMASFSGMIIERTILFNDIEILYESMIDTLVTALDQRDPITAGHSKRVAKYAVSLARDVSDYSEGELKETIFSAEQIKELYIAGMLHDVGKIGVREYVLMKSNRLNDAEISALKYRLKYIKLLMDSEGSLVLDSYEEESREILENLDKYVEILESINVSNFLPDDKEEILKKLRSIKVIDRDGSEIEVITDNEFLNLSIKKGNLTADERNQINNHALHSFNILMNIQWTKDLELVPYIASEHHEKLDGTGYPLGKKGDELSLRAKILAIADIYDALTAKDRPYKPAMPIEKALSIIKEEADFNHLDKRLVDIFVQKESYILKEGE